MLLSCTIYCTFHCALLRCSFHVLLSLLLITLESKRCQSNDSTLLFIKDLPSVSQSNVQAVTAETEVQYTLSNIIYFKFQNCCFFSFRSILKEVLLRCTQAKYSMEFIFSANLQGEGLQPCRKYAPLQKFSKIFAQI